MSFELPKAVSKFAGLSDECLKIADSIIDCFIGKCSPRDMLPVLCEVLCVLNVFMTELGLVFDNQVIYFRIADSQFIRLIL